MGDHMNEGHSINTKFDAHDFEQLIMLARLNKIPRAELIRKIFKEYLDGAKVKPSTGDYA